MDETTHKKMSIRSLLYVILPLLCLGIFLLSFLKFGPLGVFKTSVAPIEDAFIQRVVFKYEQISIDIYNNGAEPVTIAQVMVNDAYWKFEMDPPDNTLDSREKGTLTLFYQWLHGD